MAHGVLGVGLVPHPPIMCREVGGHETRHLTKTLSAMDELARWILQLAPDRVVVISPHGPTVPGTVPILDNERASGDLSMFGAPEVHVDGPIDRIFVHQLQGEATRHALSAKAIRDERFARRLDHGSVIPLHFFPIDCPWVMIGYPDLDRDELAAFGRVINETAESLRLRVLVLVSGDLSHSLSPDAPAGYEPRGKVFDEALVQKLDDHDIDGLFDLPHDLVAQARQCGFNPLLVGLGAIRHRDFSIKRLSYEGPFGVGYAVASMSVRLDPCAIARQAAIQYIEQGEKLRTPPFMPAWMQCSAGVFVTFKKQGELRGCIGTVSPVKNQVVDEIIENAVSAAMRDPRFAPIDREELPNLSCSVDILKEPEVISSLDDLDPQRFGVIVSKGKRRGLLLPNLPGIRQALEQVQVACRKAGIDPNDRDIRLERFEVTRYEEE